MCKCFLGKNITLLSAKHSTLRCINFSNGPWNLYPLILKKIFSETLIIRRDNESDFMIKLYYAYWIIPCILCDNFLEFESKFLHFWADIEVTEEKIFECASLKWKTWELHGSGVENMCVRRSATVTDP